MIASKQLIIFPLIIRREHWKRYSQRSFPFYRAFCKHMQAQPQKFKNMSPFLTCFPHLPFGKALRAGTHSARARKSTSPHYATRCVGAKKSERTRNFVLSSGARRSLPRRRCSSHSAFEQVSACITMQRIGKVQKKRSTRVLFLLRQIARLFCACLHFLFSCTFLKTRYLDG